MDKISLASALTSVLIANDVLAQSIMEQADRAKVNPYDFQNPDGSYPMAMVLNTRATALSALTVLRLT